MPFLNNKSLLEQTIDRLRVISEKKNIGVITTEEQEKLVVDAVGERLGFVIKEPSGRNTGPAVLYSCLESNSNDNDILVFLPADHFIPDSEKYCSYLKKAIDHAQHNNKIVTLGLMPTHPATGYGYIQANSRGAGVASTVVAGNVYDVKKFHEKPDRKKAEKYVRDGDMFWNLGMFVGKKSVFVSEFEQHAPEIFSGISDYESVPSMSIDYAVMEKSDNLCVIPCDFEWNDIGNLDVFLSIQQRYEAAQHKLINIDSENNIAKTEKKIVAFIGVDDLCVVEDGDVIVVAKRREVEKVKNISFQETSLTNKKSTDII